MTPPPRPPLRRSRRSVESAASPRPPMPPLVQGAEGQRTSGRRLVPAPAAHPRAGDASPALLRGQVQEAPAPAYRRVGQIGGGVALGSVSVVGRRPSRMPGPGFDRVASRRRRLRRHGPEGAPSPLLRRVPSASSGRRGRVVSTSPQAPTSRRASRRGKARRRGEAAARPSHWAK